MKYICINIEYGYAPVQTKYSEEAIAYLQYGDYEVIAVDTDGTVKRCLIGEDDLLVLEDIKMAEHVQ